MFLRLHVPQRVFLYATSKAGLQVTARFTYKRYETEVNLVGGEIEKATWAERESPCQWYRRADEIQIVLSDSTTSNPSLAELCSPERREDLNKLCEGVTLRILRVIRNIGIEPGFPETLPREGSVEEQLRFWEPKRSEDGATWAAILPGHETRTLVSIFTGARSRFLSHAAGAELNTYYWDRINEVLEDHKEIPPEDEFLTNTLGHLRARNYRLSLVESIIGLEIVLTQYLRVYLKESMRFSKARIDKFVNRDLGLTARVAGLLDLTIHESWLKDVQTDRVLQAISWRNHIIHETGNLPKTVVESAVRDSIQEVVKLARILAERREGELATADNARIVEALKTKKADQNCWARLWFKPWHRVELEVNFFGRTPTDEEMEELVQKACALLQARDRRFVREAHLGGTFYHGYPKECIAVIAVGVIVGRPPARGT